MPPDDFMFYKMLKFFLLIFFTCAIHGANTELDPDSDEADNASTGTISTYSNAYAHVETETEKVVQDISEPVEYTTTAPSSDESEKSNDDNLSSNKCLGENESLQCVRSCPPLRTCDNRNKRFHCLINSTAPCSYVCACDDGFYRNSDGFCVTSELCDKKCTGPNEEYKPDKKKCPAEICSSIVSRFACDPKEEGQPGCVCKPGFLRKDLNSTCIPTQECPELANSPENKKCSKPNESLQCVRSCPRPRTCFGRHIRYKCPDVTTELCKNECVCNDGFYRNPDGFCVTSDLCDKKCRDPNEEYKPDKKSCPPETCQSLVAKYKCDSREEGQPGCVCKPRFLRLNLNSTCIPIDQCPESKNSTESNKCIGPNESIKCLKQCPPPRTCQNRNIQYRCFYNETEICKNKCVCNDGFYRNDDGICVTREICDIPKCTLPNESLRCIKECPPPKTCENRNAFFKCATNTNKICKLKCVCDDGYYRNSAGFCVTSELCDEKCTGPNEEYKPDKKKCPPEICKSIVSRYACDQKEEGQPGCVCKSGFLRLDLNSTCIPIKQCPELANSPDYQNKTCGPNEIWNECPSGACEHCPTCDAEARACASKTDQCQPARCTCRNNYRRAYNDTCIPTRDCPPYVCSGPNEQFDACPVCPSDDCSRATPDGGCPRIGRIGIPLQCRPSCRCKPNYWRNGDLCVPYETCPNIQNPNKCTGPNESIKCVKQCPPPRTCGNRGIQFNCFYNETEICQNKCVCNDGFYRNEDGFCVTTELCDKICDAPNEEYKPDKKKCPPEICNSILALYKCDPEEKPQPGCGCKAGYLRKDLNSSCIPTELCPELVNSSDDCFADNL